MKKIKDIKRIYFIGIGGVGMSALARYFKREGADVSGYDLVNSAITKELESEGIKVYFKEKVKHIPNNIDLVVYTPAIPSTHKELVYCRKNNIPLKKRADVLGLIGKGKRMIAVAGTHGKTTTTALITQLLNGDGKEVSAFLGGILTRENTNFIHGDSDIIVAEADEYDKSFLHLHPEILIITSMDADHLDVYGDEDSMQAAYKQLTLQIKKKGVLVLGPGVTRKISSAWIDKLKKRKIKIVRILRDFDFDRIRIEDGKYTFNVRIGTMWLKDLEMILPGIHNIINASIAVLIAKLQGVDSKKIAMKLRHFKGIKRRFETVYRDEYVLIDDYAHHPEEIRFAVKTVKDMYPGKKVLGIFQPHLYSRTSDFYKGFADALKGLDGVIVLPIYPARELPIVGINSELIFNLIPKDEKFLAEEDELLDVVRELKEYEIVITLGASDLDKHHKKLIKVLKNNR